MHGRSHAIRSALASLLMAATLAGCGTEPSNPADLVLLGGKVVTVDSLKPEAQAIAVKDGRVLAVGSDDEVRAYVGRDTRVIDLAGHLAIPGLIEGHAHFMGVGRAGMQLDLMGVKNFDEIVALVKDAVGSKFAGVTGSSACPAIARNES